MLGVDPFCACARSQRSELNLGKLFGRAPGRFELRFIGIFEPDHRLTMIAEPHIDQGDIGVPFDFWAGLRRRAAASRSSTQTGAWSLAFSFPRTARSTPAPLRRLAIKGLRSICPA
jgi:hypothetical protein